MSDEETSDGYEVGYGKPPRHTRFKKGVSGNPKGRRKTAPDLDAELSKELNSPITINDRGKRRRISKIRGILKQLSNKALSGDIRAARLVLDYHQQQRARAAVLAAQEPGDIENNNDPEKMTTAELERWVAKAIEKMKEDGKE